MKAFVLASGSSGNCSIVSYGGSNILIDAGIGPRVLKKRLEPLGLDISDIDSVLLTHAHSDHIMGLAALAEKTSARVICPQGVLRELSINADILTFCPGEKFRLGEFEIETFPVSHDAADPCGFVFTADRRLGYFTDSGTVTPAMIRALSGCEAVVCEANYDPDMLRFGPYPYHLKARIAGRLGHLSNDDCGALLRDLWHTGCRAAVLAHLSRTNNSPEAALKTVAGYLGSLPMALEAASQTQTVEVPFAAVHALVSPERFSV